jgi:hypothetical protein
MPILMRNADPAPSFTHVGKSLKSKYFYFIFSHSIASLQCFLSSVVSNVPYFQYFYTVLKFSGKKLNLSTFFISLDLIPIRQNDAYPNGSGSESGSTTLYGSSYDQIVACRAAVRWPRVRISALHPSGGRFAERTSMRKNRMEHRECDG